MKVSFGNLNNCFFDFSKWTNILGHPKWNKGLTKLDGGGIARMPEIQAEKKE